MVEEQISFIGCLSKTGEVVFKTNYKDIFNKPDVVDFDEVKGRITIEKDGLVGVIDKLEFSLVTSILKDKGFTIMVVDTDGNPMVNHRYGPPHQVSVVKLKNKLY